MDKRHFEKLSLLQDLITLSEVDGNVSFLEKDFIRSIATQLGISDTELTQLKNNPIDYEPEDKEIYRITQFYRLLLLMNVDQHQDDTEISFCKEVALKMGLNPIAINTTINLMANSATGMISPDDLIKIFQTHHN